MNAIVRGLGVAAIAVLAGVVGGLGVSTYYAVDDAPLAAEIVVQQKPFVVRVGVETREGEDVGSGSLIRQDLILTNNHVVADLKKGGTINVSFFDGTVRPATIIKRNKKFDLAVLRISPVLIEPVLPGKPVAKRQLVTICGFPFGKSYKEVIGSVSGWRSFAKDTNDDVFLVNRVAGSGMSGGPVLDSENRLVGILWGSKVYANCGELSVIKDFLEGVK